MEFGAAWGLGRPVSPSPIRGRQVGVRWLLAGAAVVAVPVQAAVARAVVDASAGGFLVWLAATVVVWGVLVHEATGYGRSRLMALFTGGLVAVYLATAALVYVFTAPPEDLGPHALALAATLAVLVAGRRPPPG